MLPQQIQAKFQLTGIRRTSATPRRKFIRRAILMGVIGTLVIAPLVIFPNLTQAQTSPESNDKAATSEMGLVNEWRIQQGLMPLELNPVLQKMAMAQADFVLPHYDNISSEEQYHHDAKDRSPIKRAIEVFNWPNYSIPERVVVGENAAEHSVKGALKFWKGSPIHAKTATNPNYREVGIVALPVPKGGYLFYMNFGSRPGKLTVMISPEGGTLYLSREMSPYSKLKDVKPVVQIFDSNRKPLTDPLPYVLQMDTPAGAGDVFYVKYLYGTAETWVTVDRARDTVIMPGQPLTVQQQLLAVKVSQDVAVAQPTTAPTAAPTAAPTVTPTPTDLLPTDLLPTDLLPTATSTDKPIRSSNINAPATNTPHFAATPTVISTAVPTTALIIAPTTAVPAGQADLTIFYDASGLFVYNSAGRALKLDGLKIGRYAIDVWQNVAPLPAKGLPIGNCLAVFINGAANPTPPAICKYVWVSVTASASRAFWTTAAFDVSLNGVTLQTCALNNRKCVVKLP